MARSDVEANGARAAPEQRQNVEAALHASLAVDSELADVADMGGGGTSGGGGGGGDSSGDGG
eukprot:2920383-Prymnesium_polylepis.1